ncbi:MAG: TetR/AcrR family transcriptional regulator [Tenericutes bacterium]|nr:TetR/AcrR family transcriptional regulator [Mycoplasmatota bacterium]
MKTLQQAKYDLVLSSIKPLMLENGIVNLKISDIAKEIEVGEATIYRYFGSKTNIVIEVGVSLWEDIFKEINNLKTKETGYASVKGFFNFFLDGYKNNREVFTFLDEFDSLMVKEKVSKEALQDYDLALYNVKSLYDGFFSKGLADNTIKKDINPDEFYYTTTHMILGICKRLAAIGAILSSDDLVQDVIQIKLGIDICMQYIKN